MFERILVEKNIISSDKVRKIISHFKSVPVKEIESIEDIFGTVKKPYLQKRDNLQLFLGHKKGSRVKMAPDAYGVKGEPHYYFIHAYNCIYECQYCYLQGYFHSPDIVLFLNHDEIAEDIQKIYDENGKNPIWFHAGEFSDSLALSHITGELPFYFDLFSKLPKAKLELRTKSVNIKELLKLNPLSNVITSFSLAPEKRIKRTDLKTPSLSHRLKAIKELQERDFPVGIHLDPIIHEDNFEAVFDKFFTQLNEQIDCAEIEYVSMGVVRFSSQVFHQFKKNYPHSDLLSAEFTSGFDGKIRYPKPFRRWILQKVKDIALQKGFSEQQIYLCME